VAQRAHMRKVSALTPLRDRRPLEGGRRQPSHVPGFVFARKTQISVVCARATAAKGKNPRRAPSSWKLVLIDAAIPVSAPDRARGQIEAAGAGRQIGDDENGQDADGRDGDAAQEQCDDEKRIR
jgi:hypothetical protein